MNTTKLCICFACVVMYIVQNRSVNGVVEANRNHTQTQFNDLICAMNTTSLCICLACFVMFIVQISSVNGVV